MSSSSKDGSQSSSASSRIRKTAAFQIPILPHTSPEAEQPSNFLLPLHKHQLRALSRYQLLENETSSDGSLAGDFGSRWDYKSRGGCLADQVGTGKTATILGLIMSNPPQFQSKPSNTLIVAPAHLISQWTNEITKFCQQDKVEMIVGKAAYLKRHKSPIPYGKHRIVLIDADTILREDKLWYDFRRVFAGPKGYEIKVTPEQMQTYRTAPNFCVRSPKGACSYDGYVYTGKLHIPDHDWSRVILDEIQDLVQEGSESQKCLLQLTRTAQYVWLLSATPFPHGNHSVEASNQLLGFQRLRMDVEVDTPLPASHPFENIKRKLYIRSPPHVADQAVCTEVTRVTEYVTPLTIEQQFYRLEERKVLTTSDDTGIANSLSNQFGEPYRALREMTVHPEASQSLRQVMSAHGREYTRNVSASVQGAAQRSIRESKARLKDLVITPAMVKNIKGISTSLSLAKKVKQFREETPLATSVFEDGGISEAKIRERKQRECQIIHNAYCTCSTVGGSSCFADRHIHFRVIRARDDFLSPEFLSQLDHVVEYFDQELAEDKEVPVGENGTRPAINNYISWTERTLKGRQDDINNMRKERQRLQERIDTLSEAPATVNTNEDLRAKKYGSKPAALIRFLEARSNDEKVIVFSYWHDTLKLIQTTLRRNKLNSVFCDKGRQMSQALTEFTSGDVRILLLSAESKASGANLQVASHVVLLDPAGSSAEHGSALEEQAIGRAVRMGQNRNVTVTRFCCKGTLETELFLAIDKATEDRNKKANDLKYVIQDADRAAPRPDEPGREEVEVTASLTPADRVKQLLQKAEEEGNVVDLLDDSDDDEEQKKEKPTPSTKLVNSSIARRRVKLEKLENEQQSNAASNSGATTISVSHREALKEKRANETALESPPKRFRTSDGGEGQAANIAEGTPAQTLSKRTVTPLTREVSMEEEKDSSSTMANAELRQLLARYDLGSYEEKFLQAGYDSVSWLYEYANNESIMEQLSETVGFKPGHAIRFQTRLMKEAASKDKTLSVEASR